MLTSLRKVLLFLLVFCATTTFAQDISVVSFKLLENDLAANTTGTMERDQNGETAALIKVVTSEQGFVFDGGMVGIVKTKQGVGEVWVYVPHGIKKITVQHPQLGVLRDYFFPTSIEKAKTYEMKLTTSKVETFVSRSASKQYVIFNVTPANAIVELDGMPLDVDGGGNAEKSMPYGTYDYRVSCANYHTEAGKIIVSAEGKVEKSISLRPNFGWIKFEGDEGSLGADVYINGERVGQVPFTTKEIKSGEYSVKVVKNMYKDYETQVVVSDNESQILKVQLEPNFGWISLDGVDEYHGAHVYIDNERVGQLPFTTDKLASGSYRVKVLKSLYKPYEQQVTVTDNNISSLDVTLVPNFAKITLNTDFESEIWIDDKLRGKGKCSLDLELGEYTVEVKRPSHRTVSDVITVSDIVARAIQLPSPTPIYGVLDITSTPSRAIVYVDGVKKGETPLILNEMLIGNHEVVFEKEGYSSVEKVVDIHAEVDNEVFVELPIVRKVDSPVIRKKENQILTNEILITSTPSIAIVEIDGKKVGHTPLKIILDEGYHLITLHKRGFRSTGIYERFPTSNSVLHLKLNKIEKKK